MVIAKAGVSFIEKIAPTAVKALGKAGVAEMALLAGGVAEGLNLLVTPIVDKAGEYLKNTVQKKADIEKQKLVEKRAALLEQKAQKAKALAENVKVQTEEVKEVEVEEIPTKASNNKKKNK